MSNIISQEIIEQFLTGEDPEKYIVSIEYSYMDSAVYKIIQDPIQGKIIKKDTFTPFLWVDDLSQFNFYKGNKSLQKKKMVEHGIFIERMETHGNERMEDGLTYMIKSFKGYNNLINFFKQGGIDPWSKEYRDHFALLSPVEQYLIQKKKRLFKGLDEYGDVYRMVFDIETTGLDPETDKIIMIGIKDNRGYSELIPAFGEDGEKKCIEKFFRIVKSKKPSIIGGYNSASFDFPFIEKRAQITGVNIKDITQIFNTISMKVRDGMLKLANEVEPYKQYKLWGINVIDIAHSVRRAQAINSEIKSWGLKYITKFIDKEKSNRIYVDGAFISKIYLENESYYVNPKTGGYRKIGDPGTEDLLERYPGKFEIWTGRKIVEQYLDDDIYETMVVDDSFSQASFLLSKVVPTTYERISTMGTATLWKIIMLAWSYDHKLAVPKKDTGRPITGGLSRLLSVGYAQDVVKFDYSSLYPSIQLVYDVFPTCDVMHVQKSMLKYFRDIRIKYKLLYIKYEKIDPIKAEMFDRKQLPLKIFINAYFGSLSAPHVFPWADMNIGETITCVGRQTLRMMIMWFVEKGYTPLVMDTDGVNFSSPEDVESRTYVGKGLNGLVEKDKTYSGINADTAEFNDIFMRGEMGLDIDYISPSCINVSRKNYIIKLIKKGKEKIKLTGNTIKSKKLQQYVVEFLDVGFKQLLNGDGSGFIDHYYNYVSKISNQEIPLSKIANKARVKMLPKAYRQYIKGKTKSGNSMARQAHMELVLKENYPASLGETIYYINNSDRKSHGDVQKIPKVDEVKLNCYMIHEADMINNPEMTGEYNVARYLSQFNKRIEPLLVVFNPEIREDIIVTDIEKRGYFTKKQCELVNGFPLKPEGQDVIDEVLTLSDSEVLFWNRIKRDPFFMYLDGSINHVDQKWVKHNRDVLNFKIESIPNRDDGIIERNGHDYATHTNNI